MVTRELLDHRSPVSEALEVIGVGSPVNPCSGVNVMDPSGSTVQVPSPGTTSSLPSSEGSASSSSSVIPVMTTVPGITTNSISSSFSSNKCPVVSLYETSHFNRVPH